MCFASYKTKVKTGFPLPPYLVGWERKHCSEAFRMGNAKRSNLKKFASLLSLAFTNPTQKEFMLLGRRELLLLPRRPHARNYGHFPRFYSRNTLLLPTIQINSSLTTFVPCFSRLELNLLFHFPALRNLLML